MARESTQQSTQRELRKGTRQAFVWWGIAASCLICVVVLVWVFVFIPRGEPGSTAGQASGGPTGPLANQGSGQSTAAKHDAVLPQTSPRVGAGQNSPAAAAQIERSAAPLKLTDQQRAEIHSYFAGRSADRTNSVDFALQIGLAVPQNVRLQTLPGQVAAAMDGYRADQYIFVGDQLVIVEPTARRVVAIVPNAG